MSTEHSSNYDIVIVGAGLVGTSVIVGLQQSGFRIAVLEKHLPRVVEPEGEDYRPLSLAYGGQQHLDQWGIWSELSQSAMPIHSLHVSEQGRLGRVLFSAALFHLPALAYVVPFSLLQQTLYQSAAEQNDVTFISIDKISTIVCNKEGAKIDYSAADEEHHVTASLLIAADGTHSTCRELLDIPAEKERSDDVAFIATINCETPHDSKAYQRFSYQGSLALLPLSNILQYRLVWTLKSKGYELLKDESDEALLKNIAETFGGRLGALRSIKREAHYPLQTVLANETVRQSVVLLGNAAHTIYPVAAQGFNLSLQDVATLTRFLKRAKQENESIGDLALLNRYHKACQARQKSIIEWTGRVASVFHWRIPILDHARGMGLLALDALPDLKKQFARNFLYV